MKKRIIKSKVNLKEYQQLCRLTAKKFADKDKEISDWGLGVAGEAGDLAGCIKKTIYHENDQRQGIRENIGDTMWYLTMICNFFGWQLEEILAENIKKLRQRYPKGFTHKDARRHGTRIDWNEK
ncbi:MAG TPA: nucleoside triphosphate pyrophosphohydrolase family protein [Candidatus Bathyarchaeia archaeon]|nr:nucleoside triphosphate pyrophosphohydrolase family protein [Candidatus Bathyarchaeia archaeon]